jgi:hypothetical protein
LPDDAVLPLMLNSDDGFFSGESAGYQNLFRCMPADADTVVV